MKLADLISLMSLCLFSLVIRPLDPTSKHVSLLLKPLFSMSETREEYFSSFLFLALAMFGSKDTVSSPSSTILLVLSIITMSGLSTVATMSLGIVPPLMVRPGRSA